MESFKDKNGKVWVFELNIGAVKRIRAIAGEDVFKAVQFGDGGVDMSGLQGILEDPVRLVTIAYAVCRGQADSAGVSQEAFDDLFDADAIDALGEVFVKEFINFSQPVKRKVLTLIYQKTREMQKKAEQELERAMEEAGIPFSAKSTSLQES